MLNDICIVPIKKYSERITGKNFRLVNGVPLYQIFTTTLKQSKCFDRLVVDTDSDEIIAWCQSVGISYTNRIPDLASNTANGNSLLRYHVKLFPNYKRYWQAFVTSPFITVDTVQKMVRCLQSTPMNIDSIMSVEECRGYFWTDSKQPINYRPETMLRSQDAKPIYKEVCGLFGVMKEGFDVSQTRFGINPYFYVLPPSECVDIDWEGDLAKLNQPAAHKETPLVIGGA